MFKHAPPPEGWNSRHQTWGGVGPATDGAQVPGPIPLLGLDPSAVVHTGEVTIDVDGTLLIAKTFETVSER